MDGKALDVRKFQFSYTHKLRLLDTDYADEKFDRLEIYFDLLRKEPDKKPYYSKQDLIELIRLAYKHYPVDSITLADGNFDMRSPSSSDYYEGSYAVFPHRGTCAWMIGLPHKIGQSDIPDTAEAIDIDGKNTLVVSNRDEWFTSFNAEHVQKANFLEIALWEKGLLPVF
ncbi:immunity 52 family protein [Neisseria subflava]|uniref:Immunity 52 family protein n=1 Tax=Neisseria subflava TaxID=28449 RepID=A0A9X9N2C7_NEISU|nr:Imm52 family immunity protein [Neisseria subflava]UTG70745.1 immunity 52 family protein [Neisseria subflava]